MERFCTELLPHRSRSPKGVTKQPLVAERATQRWLTKVEKGSNISHVSNWEMNASELPFKVSKAHLAGQNITFETCDRTGTAEIRLPTLDETAKQHYSNLSPADDTIPHHYDNLSTAVETTP